VTPISGAKPLLSGLGATIGILLKTLHGGQRALAD